MNWIVSKLVPFKDQLLLITIVALGLSTGYYAYFAHDNDNMRKLAVADRIIADEKLNSCNSAVNIQNAAILQSAIDKVAKDAEYKRAMDAKPKYKTKFIYQVTGNECKDLQGIVDEAMLTDGVTGDNK